MSKHLPSKLGHAGRLLFALALTMSVLAGLGLAGQELVTAQGEVVSIDPPDQEVWRGQTFTVDVTISGAEDLRSFQFDLMFSPDLVEFQSAELNTAFWADSDRTPFEAVESVVGGTLNYVVVSEPPAGEPGAAGPDGDGVLATLTFEAIGQGTSDLDLENTLVYSGEEEREPTEEDGSVTSLVAMAIDPEESVVNPEDEFTIDVKMMGARDLRSFEFNLAFNAGVLELQGVELNTAFWAGSDRTPKVFTEEIDNTAGTLNYVVISEPPAGEPGAAGPDGDGVLATITFKALAEGESDLDLSDLESFAGETAETPDDMDGVVYVVGGGVTVLPETSSVSECGTFEVELALGGDVTDVRGYTLNLDWDADVFEVEDVEIDPAFWDASNRTPEVFNEEIDNTAGTLNFVVISEPPASGDPAGPDSPGVLAVVTLNAIAVGDSDLTLRDVSISEGGIDIVPAALTDGFAEATPKAEAFEFSAISSPQVAGQGFMVTITAVDGEGEPAEHFSGTVSLSDDTETLMPDEVVFEDGEPAMASMTITEAGEDITIMAEGTNACGDPIEGESDPFDVEADVESPDPDTAVLTPDPATVTAGDSVTYTLVVDDIYGNTFDATALADTTFSIETGAGGSFDAVNKNVYTSEFAGTWTVTADYLTVSEDATLTVEADAENPEAVMIDPDEVTLRPGECVTFTLTGEDALGNTFEVTEDPATTFSTDGGGTVTDNQFCAETPGEWTVTGDYLGLSDDAAVTVEAFRLFLPIVANNFSP